MEVQIVRSKRKTISVEITREGAVLVRAPYFCSNREAEAFVKRHEKWIETHLALFEERKKREPDEEELKRLRREAKEKLPPLVKLYSERMGLRPAGITITSARTRFGSCSGENRLSFSCRLMQYPMEAVEYVVVHELAHIRHHNHQKEFYALVARYLPDYKERAKLLKG